MAQIETRDFYPPLGVLGGPAEPWTLASGVDQLDLAAHRGKDAVLIAQAINPTGSYALGPYGPLGDMVYPDGGEWGWLGTTETIYISATTGRSTDNDDEPPAQWVPGGLAPSLNFGQKLFEGVDPLARSSGAQGEIAIIDPKGNLDYLDRYIWDGTPLIIKRGKRGTQFKTWDIVGRYNAAGHMPDVDTRKIALRDLGWQLEGPLHSEFYAGTGGLEGDASLAGRWKPYGIGYSFNSEPVQLSAAAQVYQCSFTPIANVFDLRHGGVSLTFSADYPNYAALAAAAIPAGYYATCLAQGLVRPNVALQFGIRVDMCGDNSTAYGHPMPTSRAACARRVATAYGTNRVDDSAQIDVTAFLAVDARHPAPVGWFWSDQISKADALTQIMLGILGWWRVRPDGRLSIGYVKAPDSGSLFNLPYKSNGMGKPRVVAWAPPRAGTLIGWRKNFGPQQRSELAGGVDDATAAILAQGSRYAQNFDPSVASKYPTAQVIASDAGFWNEVDAQVEANRQQPILGVERRRWQWTLQIDPNIDLLGEVVTLTGFNRLGAGAAMPLLCVGIDTPGTNTTTFDWWG